MWKPSTSDRAALGVRKATLRGGFFIAGRTVIEASRRAGKGASREALVLALTGLHDFDLGGFVLDFDAERRVGSRFVELTMISANGNLTR